ncbi:ferric reductase-like transmembrane domain-containing protein [Aestuariivirga sp.]|uniref:ferric reductase-like transmembrane domain-containing protein n=1 Tax=Aestuariivirga sp. TaxID=2650926 RepID=UPI003BA99908
MLKRLIDSHLAFRLLLALPALWTAWQFFFHLRSFGLLLDQSGQWAMRLLVLTLAITPLRLLMKQLGLGPHWPMWLFKRRRDLGLATFLYAAAHLCVYLIRQSNLHVVLFDMQYIEFIMGWLAFVTLFALALTSNDASVHRLGLWWKPLQRLAYVSVIAAALHWYWIRLDHRVLWATVLPLVALEAYRLFHNYTRPAGVRH